MQKLPIICISIGVVVGVLALVVGFQVFPKLLKKKIQEQGGQLVNGTTKWESWRVVPIPVYQKIYVFNVTNPEDVTKRGERPILQQVGPFVYQQVREKKNISIDAEEDTISYVHHDEYFFRPDKSNGSLDDYVTVLNMPFMGTVAKAKNLGNIEKYVLKETLKPYKEGLYVKVTLNEFLFGGYYVPFIKELSELKGQELLPDYTFGLYYKKNGSESEMFKIHAGKKNPSKFGSVISYNGKSKMGFYGESSCDAIVGNDGTTMAPFLTKDREFNLFVSSFCHNMRFTYDSDVEILGIPAYKYSVPKEHLQSPRNNPDNGCYCVDPGENYENCLEDGVWDLSACRGGTPLAMSFPHFYDGSKTYVNQSIGLNPKKELHEMFVVLEPTTSISMQVSVRVQMNMHIEPTKTFKTLKKIPEMMHPIFWMEQGVTIPPDKAQLMKDKLIRTQELAKLGTYAGLGLGILLIFSGIVIYICIANSTKKDPKAEEKKANESSKSSHRYSLQSKTIYPDEDKFTPLDSNFLPRKNPPAYTSPESEALLQKSSHDEVQMDGTSSPLSMGGVPLKTFQQGMDEVDRKQEEEAERLAVRSPTADKAFGKPFPMETDIDEDGRKESINTRNILEMESALQDIQKRVSEYE